MVDLLRLRGRASGRDVDLPVRMLGTSPLLLRLLEEHLTGIGTGTDTGSADAWTELVEEVRALDRPRSFIRRVLSVSGARAG